MKGLRGRVREPQHGVLGVAGHEEHAEFGAQGEGLFGHLGAIGFGSTMSVSNRSNRVENSPQMRRAS